MPWVGPQYSKDFLAVGEGSDQKYRLAIPFSGVNGSKIHAGSYVSLGEREPCVSVCSQDKRKAGYRDAVVFIIVCMLGMRREELSKWKHEGCNESTQLTKISGKKKKGRPNFLTGNVLVEFNDWITIRGKTSGPLSNPINKGNNILRVGITPLGPLILATDAENRVGETTSLRTTCVDL